MSQYTTREILDMIEENGGPDGLDLPGADLTGIDFSTDTIQAELEKARKKDPETQPVWVAADKYDEHEPGGGVYLAWANLQEADVSEANLQGAYLLGTNLQGAYLYNADLEEAYLRHTNLRESDLRKANLQGVWGGYTNFQEADLSGADLQDANFSVSIFRRTDLSYANLQGTLLGGADLREAFMLMANLQEADLGDADLGGARLVGADLQGANLSWANLQEADLRRADLRGTSLRGVRLERTEIDLKNLGPDIGEEVERRYEDARDAYLRLKRNFHDLGDYAASAWAYQKERQMEKECNAPWRARRIYGSAELQGPSFARVCWFYARHTVKWTLDWTVEYLCGYGENPIRVALWMAFSLFGFATYYWRIGGVWLIDPGKGAIGTASSFRDYFIYSLGAFTTTQFATFQAADARVRLLTGIQAIWGIFLAGVLGFVVANKIRRS